MTRRAFMYFLASIVMLMTALALAEEPRGLGELLMDQDGWQIYLVRDGRGPTQDQTDEEEITANGLVKTRVKALETWTEDVSGFQKSWFSVSRGEHPIFAVDYDLIDGGDYTATLTIRGPDRYRATTTGGFNFGPGGYTTFTYTTVPTVPGYYKFMYKIKSKGGSVVKGTYSIIP